MQTSDSKDDDVKKNKCPAVPIKPPKRKVVHAVAGSDDHQEEVAKLITRNLEVTTIDLELSTDLLSKLQATIWGWDPQNTNQLFLNWFCRRN